MWGDGAHARRVDGWERLGRRIVADRSRRWRTREEFADACGLSVRVLADLENGKRSNYLEATFAAVEVTLGWAAGSCLRVVQGGRVRHEADPVLTRLLHAWPRLSPDARLMLAELAERSTR